MPTPTYAQKNHILGLYRKDKRAALQYLFNNVSGFYDINGQPAIYVWQEYESLLTPGSFYGSYQWLTEAALIEKHEIIWNNDRPGIYWTYGKYNPKTYKVEVS